MLTHHACQLRPTLLVVLQNPEKALHGLHECLKAVLVQFKREPSTERCIRYVVRLATYGVEKDEVPLDDEFSMGLCEWLLKMSSSRDKAVRYRVCQLVESLMNALSDDAEITDTLWDSLLSSMLERLRDKVPLLLEHARCLWGRVSSQMVVHRFHLCACTQLLRWSGCKILATKKTLCARKW